MHGLIITVVCSQRENIIFDQSLFLLPVWPCRKTKDTWYWNVFQKNETDCSTVTLMSCSGLDHPLLQQLPHHQTDPKCIDEEHKNCTMKTDFYSLWSKWYWPEFHHKTPLILLFSKYMKLFEIWFLSYGPWNSVLKSLLTGLWPFFLMLMRKDLTAIVFGHSAGIP